MKKDRFVLSVDRNVNDEAREKDATSIMSTQARMGVITTPFATALIEGNLQRVEETNPCESNTSLMTSVRAAQVTNLLLEFGHHLQTFVST